MTRLRQLRYFVAVAEEGHITRAARTLQVSQPSLSQAIVQLESQLGVELLRRHARGVSLTPAGAALFVKARTALAAAEDAELTAHSLARAADGSLEWGFIGTPPMVDAPELFGAFSATHPEVTISFRELSSPCGSTAAWLQDVDVALCQSPTPHPDVNMKTLREEARVLLAASTHPLASRRQVDVADVLDETFCGCDPSLEPVRAGFWRLDDHRGGPGRVTADRTKNAQEWIAVIMSGRAIMAAPASTAERFLSGMPGIATIALRDAYPSTLKLVWHKQPQNSHVDALVEIADGAAARAAPTVGGDGQLSPSRS
jgi:DNA-binding transcriptional LysR family regulator